MTQKRGENSLKTQLPKLVPKAVEWAERQEAYLLKEGEPLNGPEMNAARAVGVAHPELVRILEVQDLPLPDDRMVRQTALSVGLFSPRMSGVTFGYGIYVRSRHRTIRELSRELRHIYQYEQAGSVEAYVSAYINQVVSFGYLNAPYEIDARKHEQF